MARMLASVQKCVEVSPIQGADMIEMVRVLGWECVVRKGSFRPGDLGVYIETDSIVPGIPAFAFLKGKNRIRTIRLRGAVSQGLFMPFHELGLRPYREGTDLTELLKIEKWEPEEEKTSTAPHKKSLWWKLVYTLPFLAMFRKKVGEGASFPSHLVPKTDETRLQAFPVSFLEENKDVRVRVTKKMDGSSCTFIWNKGKFSVASRNVWFIEKRDNNFWKLAEQLNMAAAMKAVFGKQNVCLQGEMCGPGIQGNKYKFTELKFFLFGAYDSDAREYFTPRGLDSVYENLRGIGSSLNMVKTVVDDVPMKEIATTVDEWIDMATMRSNFNPDTYDEGIVIRSMSFRPTSSFPRGMSGKRWSFKVICPEFLLQHNL